jgi:alpha-acetolactate decarboxylase
MPYLPCLLGCCRWQATKVELPLELDWAGLQLALQEHFPSANVFYAILVEGAFSYIKARSVRKQTKGRWGPR